METHVVLSLGILLLIGLAGGVLINRFKLPAVTGYILAGLFAGPALLNLISVDVMPYLKPISPVALSVIALVIGGEMEWKTLKKLGRSIMWIGMLEILAASGIVIGVMLLLGQSLPMALLMGGLATATAPAATVAVIKELRAKGPVTESLMAIVALDDALGVMIFGLLAAVVKVLLSGLEGVSIAHLVSAPILEIIFSLVLGLVMGILVNILARKTRNNKTLLTMTLGVVFLTSGIAYRFGLSAILANMMVGAVIVNICPRRRRIFNVMEGIDIPIFVVFFAFAGAQLEIHTLGEVGLIGAAYVVARMIGKVSGTYLGGTIGKASPAVRKYLGWSLMPQAGVVVGLTMVAQNIYPEASSVILNIVLTSVVISELIGPILSRKALELAGEVHIEKKKVYTAAKSVSS